MDRKPTVVIIGKDGGVSKIVRTLGFRPVVAGHPEEALGKAKGTAIVLVDLPSPAAEPGFLRELSKGGCPILIIADSETPSADLLPGDGNIRILTRPVRDADLDAALRSALRGDRGTARAPRHSQRSERYLAEYAPLLDHSPAMRAVKVVI